MKLSARVVRTGPGLPRKVWDKRAMRDTTEASRQAVIRRAFDRNLDVDDRKLPKGVDLHETGLLRRSIVLDFSDDDQGRIRIVGPAAVYGLRLNQRYRWWGTSKSDQRATGLASRKAMKAAIKRYRGRRV